MADTTPIIAVVGAESLLGREVLDVLSTRSLAAHVKQVSDVESDEKPGGVLAMQEGEAVFIPALRVADLSGSRVAMLAGAPESTSQAASFVLKEKHPPTLIDMTGVLEDNPTAQLRAPMAEASRRPAPIYVIAHPAAIVMAMFLKRLRGTGAIRRVIAHLFEPASERGKRGLDELRQQTVGLLSFQKLQKDVFDTQVSFNMLPRFGEEAIRSLEDVEATVERHLVTLLSAETGIPLPSLRVVHAPVFHGHSLSVWVEFENRPDDAAIAGALATERIEVRGKDAEAPSNVEAAGQSGITVGAIAADRNDPRACWFWIVADNLRIAAENAVEVASELLA